MKIAVSATGPDLESPVDEKFGRAGYFIIIETDTLAVSDVIDNTENREASHGAGVQAAQLVADKGAEWLLTGHVGPKAFQILNQAGIKIGTGSSGTVRQAIEKFKAGEFTRTDGPSNSGHMA